LLKSFQYREALSSAIKLGNPEVVMALIEELIERGVLERALAGRGPTEFKQVVDFIKWKLTDHRFQCLLLEVTRVLLDMYSAPLINCEETTSLISELSALLDKEIAVSSQLK
jgi:U3 small nucleolar RNA-associated protein 15